MAKKKKQVEPVVEENRFLSHKQMHDLDSNTKDVIIKELELIGLKQKKRIIDLEMQMKIDQTNIELKALKEKRKRYEVNLKEELSVTTEQWGYDPITGEIKDE